MPSSMRPVADPRTNRAARTTRLSAFGVVTVTLLAGNGFAAPDAKAGADAAEAAPAAKAGADATTVLVLPYQPIYRSAEPAKVEQATGLLVQELGKSSGLAVIRGGAAKPDAAKPDGAKIEGALKAADEAEAAKRIRDAIAAHQQAIAAMEAEPGAVAEAEVFVEAHHRLARALFMAAEDDKALEVLGEAARMAPGFELATDLYSRYYRARFLELARKVVEEKPAELLVRSALPGAKVFVDGREAGTTPVRLTKLLPGKHFLQAEVAGAPRGGRVVNVKPGKNAEVTIGFGSTWGGEAVGAVADAVAENAISKKIVAQAVEAGKDAKADFVVLGGMAHDKVATKFNIHTFVVNVSGGGIQKLDMANFDLDMLTASADVFRIVKSVEGSIKNFQKADGAIASIESKVRPQSIESTFDAKPDFDPNQARKKVRRKDKGPRRVIRAVRGTGTVRIKDDK